MKRTKATYTDDNGKTTFNKPNKNPKQDYPYFKVNHDDNTEVLRDGKLFAKTDSHIDSIRVVMAMENIYKQQKKPVIHLTKREISHILVSMDHGCRCLHSSYLSPNDQEWCDTLKRKLGYYEKKLNNEA